jgi:hypothetical protein
MANRHGGELVLRTFSFPRKAPRAAATHAPSRATDAYAFGWALPPAILSQVPAGT